MTLIQIKRYRFIYAAFTVTVLLMSIDNVRAQTSFTQLADIKIGTDGGLEPAAQLPFGMVQIGPDGDSLAFLHRYHYSCLTIPSFSMTHLNGAGAAGKGHIQFLPTTGSLGNSPGAAWTEYRSAFSHSTETMVPGFYGVTLTKYNVEAELTASCRVGFAKFTFPSTTQANLLFNVVRSNNWGRGIVGWGESSGKFTVVGTDQVTGMSNAGAVNYNNGNNFTYPLYFAAQFDQPFTGFGTYKGTAISDGNRSDSGAQAGGYLTFNTTSNQVVQMKLALSYVSVANAQANLAEIPGWDIATVRAAADSAWNEQLGTIKITGGAATDITMFYSALYRCFLHPNVASDLNGEYTGFDNAKHVASDFTVYQLYSGWDIFRSWIQFVSIMTPQTLNFVKSMIIDGQEGGKGMPQWSDANKECKIMVGDPSATMVATAYAFGVRGFDYAGALKVMDDGAMIQSKSVRNNVTQYNSLHYLPGNAAITQDYAGVDFAISALAGAIGDQDKFNTYRKRGQWWKNNINTSTGYLVPKNSNGSWRTPWSPTTTDGYCENNATVYTWLLPYNYKGLFDLLGGTAAVIPRLDDFFKQLNGPWNEPYLQMGNEPSFSQPYIYNSVWQPWKSQKVVRDIVQTLFKATAGQGYPGDDDLGSMSSWLIWAYLGMYPAYPGMDIMTLIGPYFPSITLTTAQGKTVHITATGAGPNAPYVQSLTVNGVPTTKTWLHWSDIANNGTLEYVMGTTPNTNWGVNPGDEPPSFDTDYVTGVNEYVPPVSQPLFEGLFPAATPGMLSLKYNVSAGKMEYINIAIYTPAGACVYNRRLNAGIGTGNGLFSLDIRHALRTKGVYMARVSFKISGETDMRHFSTRFVLYR